MSDALTADYLEVGGVVSVPNASQISVHAHALKMKED
jgi:hypothetical protein